MTDKKEYLSCDCDGWNIGANQIFNAQIINSIHGMPYTGTKWIYCPWCGQELFRREPISSTAQPIQEKNK